MARPVPGEPAGRLGVPAERGDREPSGAGGRLGELSARFNVDVPCPPFWGGYRLTPDVIEFWHHRDNRLHDRLRYRREVNWILERLSP